MWALRFRQVSPYPPHVPLSILLISPFHTQGTNAFSESKGAMTLLHELQWEKSLYILWNWQRALQVHHFNGSYHTSQCHPPSMQNLLILVLSFRFPWASFDNILPCQSPPARAADHHRAEAQGRSQTAQSTCCSFSYFTQNLPQTPQKLAVKAAHLQHR